MLSIYVQSMDENGQVRTFPDGRPLIDQPSKLLHAFRVLGRYWREATKGDD